MWCAPAFFEAKINPRRSAEIAQRRYAEFQLAAFAVDLCVGISIGHSQLGGFDRQFDRFAFDVGQHVQGEEQRDCHLVRCAFLDLALRILRQSSPWGQLVLRVVNHWIPMSLKF